MRPLLSWLLAALLAGAAGSPAWAEWHRASTDHFVIYADQNPTKLRDYAVKLERFDKAVRVSRGMADHPVGDGNRLTLFVVRSTGAVQKLARQGRSGIAGFYIGRASGSIAVVPRIAGSGSEWDISADVVFFHEYAHHLMMQDLDSAYPEWFVEGFAEFMSTAEFTSDGAVGIGAVPRHRAYSLFAPRSLSLETMLGGSYSSLNITQYDDLYARGWLLAHYLTFEPVRDGQLVKYLDGIAKGSEPLATARMAFGDLKKLDRDLNAYIRRPKLAYFKVPAAKLQAGRIDVAPLPPGAAAVMPLRIESKRGVNEKTSGPLAARVRKIAATYPNDPLVQITLAEAEIDAGLVDAAEAAADRARKSDPRSTEALIYKGRAIMERAALGKGSDRDWDEARRWFIAANKLDKEDPEPLMLFHRSFLIEGTKPTANAIAALHYASALAPQDRGLRMTSAMQYLRDGKLKEARRTLAPIAFDPHARAFSKMARSTIALIDSGSAQAALSAMQAEDKKDDGSE